MTLAAELTKIKKIPYKVAGISEKLALVEALLVNDNSLTKWWIATRIFAKTRMINLVLDCDVKHQLQYHFNSTGSTLSGKADAVSSLMDNYQSVIDVSSLAKEVFGDSYQAIVEQINQNNLEYEEFQKRIQIMPTNSTMTDVCAVMLQVQADMKKI